MNTSTRTDPSIMAQMKTLLVPIVKRLPAYIKLAWVVALEPTIPWVHRAGLYVTVIYVLSPAHLVMNVVPVVGQIDWIVMLLQSIRHALAHCPPEAHDRIFKTRLKLRPDQLDRDIRTLMILVRHSADSARKCVKAKMPATGNVSRKVGFAGRVASGFTRRVARRIRGGVPARVAHSAS